MSVIAEIETVTKAKHNGEPRQDYLADLVFKTSELPPEEWEKLSEEAKQWYNVSVDAIDAKTEINDPDAAGDKKKVSKKPVKAKEPAPEEKKEEKAAKKEKEPKAAKEKPEPVEKPKSAVQFLYKLILDDPDMKPEELVSTLAKDGIVISSTTVLTYRNIFRSVLKFLREQGVAK